MLNSDLIQGAAAAAEFTGLPRRTIYNMVENDQLPAIKRGRRLFFRRSELEAAFRSSEAA
ncbi:MAG: helix-turn-helix domain-containing protein [Sphingomonadaceae bacterium]